MRLFFTLIASGLFIFTEFPLEQVPVPIPIHAMAHAGDIQEIQAMRGRSTDWYLESGKLNTDRMELHSSYVPDIYLDIPLYLFPSQANEADFEAREPPSVQGQRLSYGPELIPVELKVTPTAHVQGNVSAGVLENYRQPSALPVTGLAMYYNPNVMQEVLKNRLAMGHVSACNECIGNVALLHAGDLNRRVWLQWADGVVEGPFLVADVAAQQHVAQLLARNWVVDVDNRTAVRRGMVGPTLVTVLASPPTSNEQDVLPFVPLYSAVPAISPAPPTPLPALSATPTANNTIVRGGFPTETPVPTITPLPALNATPTASVTATQPSQATATQSPTNTPLPMLSPTPTSETVVVRGGFPTETPVPTITPLPPITPVQTSTPGS